MKAEQTVEISRSAKTAGKAALILTLAGAQVADTLEAFEDAGNSLAKPTSGIFYSDEVDEGPTVKVSIPIIKNDWTKADDRRFKNLMVKRATRSATPEENNEFLELQRAKRKFRSPVSAEQLLAERKRARLENNLVKSFRAYVEFVRPSDRQALEALEKIS